MSIRPAIPFAKAVLDSDDLIPTAVPVDASGKSLIPGLAGRTPTHNESILIRGDTISMGSTNVKEIYWSWNGTGAGGAVPTLFVRFLDQSLYAYYDVPLSVALGMAMTPSPGRYVWNVLRVGWPTGGGRAVRLFKGSSRNRAKPQVVRAIP